MVSRKIINLSEFLVSDAIASITQPTSSTRDVEPIPPSHSNTKEKNPKMSNKKLKDEETSNLYCNFVK